MGRRKKRKQQDQGLPSSVQIAPDDPTQLGAYVIAKNGGIIITYNDNTTRFVPYGCILHILPRYELKETGPIPVDDDLLKQREMRVCEEDIRSLDIFPPKYEAAQPG